MSNPKVTVEITASTARLPAALRAAGKMFQGFTQATTGLMKPLSDREKADPDRRSMARGAFIGGVAANLATRGIDAIAGQARAVFDYEEQLTRFGIAARKSPTEMREIGNAARKTSSEIGISAGEVLAAGRAYIDLAGAQNFSIEKMNILARAAQASGSATKDLAGMAYQLTVSMKVPDNQLENTIGGLINQAKDGAIEASQMATEFAAILPLFARFGVKGREGTIQAGAMFQIMRDGSNSAAEAGTMLQRVLASIQTNAPKFEAAGIQVYEKERDKLGRKVLLPVELVYKNIMQSDLMKDNAKLKKAFGRTEGWRGILLLDEAMRKTGMSAEELLTRYDALLEAGRANGVVADDMATITQSAFGRMDVAVEKMKNALAEAFTPERIDGFVTAIEKLSETIEPVVASVNAIGWVLGKFQTVGKALRYDFSDNPTSDPWHTPALKKLQDARKEDAEGEESTNPLRPHGLRRGTDKLTPGEQAAGERDEQSSAGYRGTVYAITKAAGGDDKAPTVESVRIAIEASRADENTPLGLGRATAGKRYTRTSGASKSMIEAAELQISTDWVAKAMGPQVKAITKSISEAFNNAISSALVPGYWEGQRTARQAVKLQGELHPDVVVTVQAPNPRRSP